MLMSTLCLIYLFIYCPVCPFETVGIPAQLPRTHLQKQPERHRMEHRPVTLPSTTPPSSTTSITTPLKPHPRYAPPRKKRKRQSKENDVCCTPASPSNTETGLRHQQKQSRPNPHRQTSRNIRRQEADTSPFPPQPHDFWTLAQTAKILLRLSPAPGVAGSIPQRARLPDPSLRT